MPPEIQELYQNVEQLLAYLSQNAGTLNQETQREIAAFLSDVNTFLDSYQPPPEAPPIQAPLPPDAEIGRAHV